MNIEVKTLPNGLRYIPMTMVEAMKIFWWLWICDNCNWGNFGKWNAYIPVLNKWYCKKCFEDWKKRAKFYPDDVKFEENNIQYVISVTQNKS